MNTRFSRASIVIMLSSFLLTECRENEDPQVIPCRLLSIESNTTLFTYQYEGDAVKTRTATNLSDGTVIKVVTYEYDDSGNLIGLSAPGERGTLTYTNGQITNLESEGAIVFTTTDFEYSGDKLVKIQYYHPASTTKSRYTTLEYSGSNATVAKTFDQGGGLLSVVQFTYGDNSSPFLAFPPAYIKLMRLEDFSISNNLTGYESSEGVEIDYVSEFNSFGFPTRTVATHKNGVTDTRKYVYECN